MTTQRDELIHILENEVGLYLAHDPAKPFAFWGQIADALIPFIERSEARTWNEGFSEGYAVGRTRQNPADSDNPYEKGMDR